MNTHGSQNASRAALAAPACQDLLILVRAMIRHAHIRVPRTDFLHRLSALVLDATGCDHLGLTRMRDGAVRYHSELRRPASGPPVFTSRAFAAEEMEDVWSSFSDPVVLGGLRRRLMAIAEVDDGDGSPAGEDETGGRFWTNDARSLGLAEGSLAVVRFEIEEGSHGLLEVRSRRSGYFSEATILFLECLAQYIGVAIADRRARVSLQRRLNELTYLYEISSLEGRQDRDRTQVLTEIVELVPSLFSAPEETRVRLLLDGEVIPPLRAEDFAVALRAPLLVEGVERGAVELACSRSEARLEAGLSHEDEQRLLDTVAGQLSGLLARREASEERQRLEQQLRHADRLATIGQLAAGVAHELNEPLANILGYAELITSEEGLSPRAERDMGKIVSAAMHGREIVQKLLIFARQMPTRKTTVDLNALVEDALFFLESRCAREGIEPVRLLAVDLPPILADPGQMRQVLVNLVVNAIQAISGRGRIFIETRAEGDAVVLSIQDTGGGMTDEVRRRIFIPFFTTKDVGQGTGLGLPVVHGIVTAHGGQIEVHSEPGHGARFDVRLPVASAAGGERT